MIAAMHEARLEPPPLVPQVTDRATSGLNERQVKAMRFLREHGEITTVMYSQDIATQITERMARKDLQDLVRRGLIDRIGRTRGTRYTLRRSE